MVLLDYDSRRLCQVWAGSARSLSRRCHPAEVVGVNNFELANQLTQMIRMICSEDHVFLTFFNIEFPPVVQAFANAFCSEKVKKECLRCIF